LRESLFAQFKLRDVSLPYLRQLASASGETASLIVPLGWYGVRVASARGSNEITSAALLGRLGALGQHYAGRTILAFAPGETITRYFAWERLRAPAPPATDTTTTDLAAIAKRGFAFEEMGFAKGRGALALPIRGGAEAIAAIAIEGPVLDLTRPRADARAVEIANAIEGAVKAHPKEFENPFGHIDPDTILLEQG
jgi:DNA-binding IclR family transcriptional regulator